MRMFDILRSATQQKIGVEIKRGKIYYFYNNEILADEEDISDVAVKHKKWRGNLYDKDDLVQTVEGTKEEVANKCIQHSIKKKVEIDKHKKFGVPSTLF